MSDRVKIFYVTKIRKYISLYGSQYAEQAINLDVLEEQGVVAQTLCLKTMANSEYRVFFNVFLFSFNYQKAYILH